MHEASYFLKFWFEISFNKISFSESISAIEKIHFAPINKGGKYRKWYGNNEYIINWKNNGEELKSYSDDKGNKLSYPRNLDYQLKESLTWGDITSGDFSLRYSQKGFFFSDVGNSLFLNNRKYQKYVLAYGNTKLFNGLTRVVNQTMHFKPGNMLQMPIIINDDKFENIEEIVSNNIVLSRTDWDSFETSWDFARHPLVRPVPTIADAYTAWQCECNERFHKLKSNEEELNRIFIEIYGLQGELTPEVDAKDVTVHYTVDEKEEAPEGLAKSNYLLTKQDMVKSLLSYAVGCMFGRYSLDVDGLAYAGGEWKAENYSTFLPDVDNIIPITDEEYFEDDIVGLFCGWLKKVYGVDTLEENLDFIAKSLGNKGNTSREVIRNYFLTDFIKDHMRTYQKRPIYWLFDAGKQNGFKCLIYLHRYTPDTIGKIRADYLHRMQRTYESEIDRMQDVIDNSTNSREVGQATKRKEKLLKQLKECREYDEMLGHLALSRILLDLDDGVKANYRKVQTGSDGKFYEILADSKNIMAKN